MTEMEKFIRDYSASIGLNPEVVMQTVLNEGGRQSLQPEGYARRSLVGGTGAGQEPSYGPFQMHMKHLGGRAKAAGYDPRDPNQAFNVAKFAMDEIKNKGLGQWYGWKGDPWAAHRGGKGTTLNSVPVPQVAYNDVPIAGAGVGPGDVAGATLPTAPGVDPAVATAPEPPKTPMEKLKSMLGGEKDATEDKSGTTGAFEDIAKGLSGQSSGESATSPIPVASSNIGMNTPDPAMMASAQQLMNQLLQGRRKRYGISLTG